MAFQGFPFKEGDHVKVVIPGLLKTIVKTGKIVRMPLRELNGKKYDVTDMRVMVDIGLHSRHGVPVVLPVRPEHIEVLS